MTAKEKAIQDAYGSAWEKVKEHVNADGWIKVEIHFFGEDGIFPEQVGFSRGLTGEYRNVDTYVPEWCRVMFDGGEWFWRPTILSGYPGPPKE